MELQCLSLQRALGWNEQETSKNERGEQAGQQEKGMTADGQDYQSEPPGMEERDGLWKVTMQRRERA